MCKGQVAQLETRIVVDKKEKECELETLTKKLKQKTEVVILCDSFAASVSKMTVADDLLLLLLLWVFVQPVFFLQSFSSMYWGYWPAISKVCYSEDPLFRKLGLEIGLGLVGLHLRLQLVGLGLVGLWLVGLVWLGLGLVGLGLAELQNSAPLE